MFLEILFRVYTGFTSHLGCDVRTTFSYWTRPPTPGSQLEPTYSSWSCPSYPLWHRLWDIGTFFLYVSDILVYIVLQTLSNVLFPQMGRYTHLEDENPNFICVIYFSSIRKFEISVRPILGSSPESHLTQWRLFINDREGPPSNKQGQVIIVRPGSWRKPITLLSSSLYTGKIHLPNPRWQTKTTKYYLSIQGLSPTRKSKSDPGPCFCRTSSRCRLRTSCTK